MSHETAESRMFKELSEKTQDRMREQDHLIAEGRCPVNDRDTSTPRVDAIANGRDRRNRAVLQEISDQTGRPFSEVRSMSVERREELLKYGY